jgi:preprotein translocase subunit SecD
MKKMFTLRVWILIAVILFSILAINPSPSAKGIEVKNVESDSPLATAGLSTGEKVLTINTKPIETLEQYTLAVDDLQFKEMPLTMTTDKGSFTYNTSGNLGFIEENLTIISSKTNVPIQPGMKIVSINNKPISSSEELTAVINNLFPEKAFVLRTDKSEYALLLRGPPQITVGELQKSNINKGLELQGGTRVLLKPVSDEEVTNQQIQDLIAVLSNRLNVYGVSDIKIRPANDIVGNKFVLVEIAAVSKEEVRDLIAQQGKFEAKIGDEVAFIGGERDVTFVCRNDGSCSGIRPPCVPNQNGYSCTFQFAITITEEAAERHAEITKNMGINTSASGSPYLEKTIDLYLDDKLVDSLNIGADLKGKALTQIAISGPGYGATEEAAYDDAIKNMNRLQTILITGSLPFKLEIAKLDTISPALGEEFLSNSILVGIVALIAVAAVIVIRYRQLKVIIPIIIISVSEVLITLGVAALIGWNMDMASIAGIIAAVGTGVNDQILITDEVLRGQGEKFATWKEKFKRAFSIILAAYLTLIAAMLPLWNAGAGLVRGFAVTTIIGVTIGVFITRPAFASMIESLLEK